MLLQIFALVLFVWICTAIICGAAVISHYFSEKGPIDEPKIDYTSEGSFED